MSALVIPGVTVFEDSYGKARVRLAVLDRSRTPHQFVELTLSIALQGDFEAAFTDGDNGKIIATDSMKNVAFVRAAEGGIASVERYVEELADFFVGAYEWVSGASVRSEQTVWTPMVVGGSVHPHAFTVARERYTASAVAVRDRETVITSGVTDLVLLKTTGSAFTGFHRDRYTTLPEATDRLFATSVTASWLCHSRTVGWSTVRDQALVALRERFATHDDSKSVQQTMRECARAMFTAVPEIVSITFVMPNLHYLGADLRRLGVESSAGVFIPTSEPHGEIGPKTFTRDAMK